ncbi:MAG TPA: hypothetical protein VIP46_20115 [Pyrinomonadaceae bacterium]
MIEKSRLNPPDTFARNYQLNRLPSATDAGRGRRKPDGAELEALSAGRRFEPA